MSGNSMQLRQNVLEVLERHNVSMGELDRACGFRVGTVKKWKDSMPAADKVFVVARVLKVTVEELMRGVV